jgi:ferredoxin
MRETIIITIEDQKIEIEKNKNLSESLDASTSPILFGCRTGVCGTCLVRVIENKNNISSSSQDEKDFLEIVSDDPRDRLACQFSCSGDVTLKYIGN